MPTPHYGQPRYRAIADELRERIKSGAIPPGAFLPAESVLTAEFKVSRGTIRQAISALRKDGLVATEHGRGTYANAQFHAQSSHHRANPRTRQREVSADEGLAELFDVEVGAPLIEQESVVRIGKRVATVTREYRLGPASS
ncbi:GntR family transcriptional regulator [Micromonospora sp. DT41]|uniref:GntR family transcriptional regulator n=1 Tax=Micromonospora sp. DT41 TaxID=3393437 RepID=UPI003CEA5CF6